MVQLSVSETPGLIAWYRCTRREFQLLDDRCVSRSRFRGDREIIVDNFLEGCAILIRSCLENCLWGQRNPTRPMRSSSPNVSEVRLFIGRLSAAPLWRHYSRPLCNDLSGRIHDQTVGQRRRNTRRSTGYATWRTQRVYRALDAEMVVAPNSPE